MYGERYLENNTTHIALILNNNNHAMLLNTGLRTRIANPTRNTMETDPLITPQSLKRLSLSVFCAELHMALTIAGRKACTKANADCHLRELLGGPNEGAILSSFLSDEVILFSSTKYTFTGADLSSFCSSKIGTVTKVNLLKCMDVAEQAFELLVRYPLLELTMCVQASVDSPCCQKRLYELGGSPAAGTLLALTVAPRGRKVIRLGADFTWLAKLKQIRRLDMSGVCLVARERDFAHALDQLSNISFLNVSGTGLWSIPITVDHLTVLVSRNTTIFSSLTSCGNLVGFNALVTLDISRDCMDDSLSVQDTASVTDVYKSLSEKPHLLYLDLSGLVVSASVIGYFDQPHHKMHFLGLVKTEAASMKEINSQVVSLHTNLSC